MVFIDYNFNRQYGSKTGWFGLFESEDDISISRALLDSAAEYLKKHYCNKMIGPAKFNASGEIGCLIDGFDKSPYFMEPYNAPYYSSFFESYGLVKENDWYSMYTDVPLATNYMERIERLQEKLNGTRRDLSENNGYLIRNIDFKNIRNEIKLIRLLYNQIWNTQNHPQQTELTEEEFDVLAAGIKAIALEDLIFIVEKNSTPVAVSVTLPNINEIIEEYDKNKLFMPSNTFFSPRDLKRDIQIFNKVRQRLKQKRFNSARILILGIKDSVRKTSIDTKLYLKTFKTARELGIKAGSGSQLADINFDILNPTFKIGKLAMTWRVYSKII